MAADARVGFRTQRSKVIELYSDSKQPFDATTMPYKSTRALIFDIVEPFPAAPNQTMVHAVLRTGQVLKFFGYGSGDAIQDGFGNNYNSTDADTNMEKGQQTNGGSDYIIEGVSLTARDRRILYPAGTAVDAGVTDPDVINAYEGIGGVGASDVPAWIGDPAALMSPPQVDSPFNLSDTLRAKVLAACSVTFQFDKKHIEVVGTLDQMPEGGAAPLLFANGDPRTDNRYKIPEGFLWRRAGETDSNFTAVVEVLAPVVIPMQLVDLFGATTAPQETGLIAPTKIALDLTMRVHGLSFSMPTQN